MNSTEPVDQEVVVDQAYAAGFQLRSPHRPARIVRPRSADEVAAAVRAARTEGRPIAVQATGHGRSEGAEGVVLISTDRLTGVAIDPRQRTVRVEAGATWGQVVAAAAEHGLAPLSGSFPGVGVVGYILGGGFGLLSRRYGYAADHVRAIEVITPDGTQRRVTDRSEGLDGELFWALRGAGASFGVVTAIELELFAEPTVVGGAVSFDLAEHPRLLADWKQWVERQPDDVLAAATLVPFPDAPGLPPHLRGRHIAGLQVCWPGPSTDTVERALAELRDLGTPLDDTIREMPYAESAAIFAEPDAPHAYRGSGWLLNNPGDRVFAELPGHCGRSAGAMCVVGIRRLGGAMADQPSRPNAVGHRDAGWSLVVLSPQQPGEADQVTAAHDRILQPWQSSIVGRALNFSYQPLTPEQVAEGYDAAAVPRLRQLRDTVDPGRTMVPNYPL